MEMFQLVSRLVLNTDDYDKSLKQAESDGSHLDDIETSLTLHDEQFQQDIEEDDALSVEDKESELTLEDSDYKGALEQAEADTESFSATVGDIFEGLKGILVTAGVTAVISGIIGDLTEAVDLARSMGDSIDKSSRAMSLSTDAYQEWQHVLDINGASITDLNRGLMNMRKVMGGGEASKEFTEGMDRLGLSAKVANGEIKSTEQLLDASLKALADYGGEDRDYIAQALFGRGGTKLNAMFDGTSKDIEDLKKQAHDLGLVMSEESVANAAAYNDSVTNMNASIQAFKIAMIEDILPSLTDMANKVATIVAFFNPRNKQKTLSEMYAGAEDEFAEQLVTIEGTADAAETLADKLLSMGDTSKMTAEQYAIWKGTAEELIGMVPELGKVIDTETGQITANSDEIKENIKQWERLAKAKALQTLKEEKLSALYEKQKDLINESVEANRSAAEAEGKRGAAIDNLNKVLAKAGIAGLGRDATYEDIGKAQARAISSYEGDEYALGQYSLELSNAVSEFTSANAKSEEAKKKVADLTAEVEKGKQEYAEWEAVANEMYGIVDEDANSAISQVKDLNSELQKLPHAVRITIGGERAMTHAIGSAYIPYDNYPAVLHRGEQVLTATEARQRGEDVNLDNLESRIENAIRRGMEGAEVRSYLNGRDITDEVNRNNMQSVKGRRFAT